MRRRPLFVLYRLCLLLVFAWLSGCAAEPAGALRLENVAAGRVYVAWSEVREGEGGFLVTGVLRRRDTVGPAIKATVDVEVISPSGDVVDRAQSDNLYVPHRRVNQIQGFERFRVQLSRQPPEGSVARVIVRSP